MIIWQKWCSSFYKSQILRFWIFCDSFFLFCRSFGNYRYILFPAKVHANFRIKPLRENAKHTHHPHRHREYANSHTWHYFLFRPQQQPQPQPTKKPAQPAKQYPQQQYQPQASPAQQPAFQQQQPAFQQQPRPVQQPAVQQQPRPVQQPAFQQVRIAIVTQYRHFLLTHCFLRPLDAKPLYLKRGRQTLFSLSAPVVIRLLIPKSCWPFWLLLLISDIILTSFENLLTYFCANF